MNIYSVSADETLYYCEKKIEAKNKEEALEKYTESLNNGMVEVANSDVNNIKIKKEKD